jgi:hypothetical protein
MATLSVQSISRSGLKPTMASASGSGDKFPHAPNRYIEVDNGSGSSVDVTVASQYSGVPQGLSSSDLTVAVPAGERRLIGPFSERAFADTDGNVNMSYSASSSVTVAAIELP